jgi:hypothetical protein
MMAFFDILFGRFRKFDSWDFGSDFTTFSYPEMALFNPRNVKQGRGL